MKKIDALKEVAQHYDITVSELVDAINAIGIDKTAPREAVDIIQSRINASVKSEQPTSYIDGLRDAKKLISHTRSN